uniref:Chondroitin sulfate proteoglycan 5 n=1 Tax=Otus sunia TaxID=257818 RepID=A0A8C8AIH5_9STRI
MARHGDGGCEDEQAGTQAATASLGCGGTSDTSFSPCPPPASEWPPQNASEAEGRGWEGSLESSPPQWDPASRDPPGGASNGSSPGGAAVGSEPPVGPQLEPPGGVTAATTDPVAMPEGCAGCAGEGDASALPPRTGSEPEGVATPWALHELYDDFTPFDEADFYPTTSFYADGDEEDELEEDDEEEEEEEEGGLEDENRYRPPASAVPGAQPVPRDPRPTGRRDMALPQPSGAAGGSPTARPRPGERGPPENGTECRSGYVRHNSSCRSVCDLVPSYCHNGGQCYLVESHGAFCRCNTQDYTWHKGTRCEAIVTDFQVMCVAVGSAALVVLLLFMLTVFFAKKLYLLKTENSKLRKTKYRTPSELHNDNFSLSTIAEGSHPNDDPSAPHKLQDSLKSCLKDEEPFNIHNSTSPKHDGSKGEQDGGGELNCLQNNLT